MEIRAIMVIGAGQMGSGIAQVAAQSGFSTLLHDISMEAVQKGLLAIRKSLAKFVEKGKLSPEEMEAALARLTPCDDLAAAAECDLAIEAVVENMGVKAKIFRELDRLAPPNAILASNTSSLPITEIAAVTGRPEQVIGMHFMNPVPLMKLVEIIRGLATSDETYEAIEALSRRLGKTTAECRDVPGFISNRVLMVMLNEAIWCLYEGVASAESIDTIMKLGMNHPMGPLTLADLIGLDTVLAILQVLQDGYGDPKYRPCPLLRQYVKAGWLGRKSGRGFYRYA
ncbi:3-hydroxybutyryl-CoA dehydrogenase [Heliobacterium undosum]|uniref:3-hydroxybutyryl-CoA dehydrogenase n=1 Tax=Heliomicrobium undosum TaxID=121734 RepID=A0A845KZT9_9FIRM|nr:3-hydroxybutyryl-CoA dehydrogenase [Heliomicrobium undosum]MZP29682.1 3-hydroxybutyryl-CoA dehydrogenase [Heliomicrobium undosum]